MLGFAHKASLVTTDGKDLEGGIYMKYIYIE